MAYSMTETVIDKLDSIINALNNKAMPGAWAYAMHNNCEGDCYADIKYCFKDERHASLLFEFHLHCD